MTSIEQIYQKKSQREHILLRPDKYVGSVEYTKEIQWVYDEEKESIVQRELSYVPGLYKIFDEILVNAADNKLRDQKMDTIRININKEKNEISIYNNGRGIPVVMHKTEKVYVPEMIFGTLHTSLNYDDQKKATGGLGAKLCNIFSTKFTVETSTKKYKKKFKHTWINNMTKDKDCEISSASGEDFTKVTFSPDLAKFKMTHLDDDIVTLMCRRACDVAASTSGVKVFLNDREVPVEGFKQYVEFYTKGIASPERAEPVDVQEQSRPSSESAKLVNYSMSTVGSVTPARLLRSSRKLTTSKILDLDESSVPAAQPRPVDVQQQSRRSSEAAKLVDYSLSTTTQSETPTRRSSRKLSSAQILEVDESSASALCVRPQQQPRRSSEAARLVDYSMSTVSPLNPGRLRRSSRKLATSQILELDENSVPAAQPRPVDVQQLSRRSSEAAKLVDYSLSTTTQSETPTRRSSRKLSSAQILEMDESSAAVLCVRQQQQPRRSSEAARLVDYSMSTVSPLNPGRLRRDCKKRPSLQIVELDENAAPSTRQSDADCRALVVNQNNMQLALTTTPIVLEKWHFKILVDNFDPDVSPFEGFAVILGGTRCDTSEEWQTSSIKYILKRRLVETAEHRYKLEGRIDSEMMSDMGFPDEFIEKVADGFPRDWNLLIQNFYSSVRHKAESYLREKRQKRSSRTAFDPSNKRAKLSI